MLGTNLHSIYIYIFFFLSSVMTLQSLYDRKLSESLLTSQAADLTEPSELCDHIFKSMFDNIANCEYFDTYDYRLTFGDENDFLILLPLNITFLHKNYDNFHEFVRMLSIKPNVICLIKFRIIQPLKNLQLLGYYLVYTKPDKKAGGIAMHRSSKITFFQLENFQSFGAESIWIKTWTDNPTKTLIISSIDRHSSEDANKFIDNFWECRKKLTDEKKTFCILGDININTNNSTQNSAQADNYTHVVTSNGAFSLITKPTTATDKSATVIDHIITNDTVHTVIPCVILNSVTDHYAIICKISKTETLRTKTPAPLSRNKKTFILKFLLTNYIKN